MGLLSSRGYYDDHYNQQHKRRKHHTDASAKHFVERLLHGILTVTRAERLPAPEGAGKAVAVYRVRRKC